MDPVAFLATKIVATVLMMVTSITGPTSQLSPAVPPSGSAAQTTGLRPWANIEVRQIPVKPNGQPKATAAPTHTSRPATSKPQASAPTAKPKSSPVVFGMADANATTTDQRVYGAGFSAYRKFFSGMPTGWSYGFHGKTEVVSFKRSAAQDFVGRLRQVATGVVRRRASGQDHLLVVRPRT